jgi:hypothetical protein
MAIPESGHDHFLNPFQFIIRQPFYQSRLYSLRFGIVGAGVQLGPRGTAATNMPTVPAPGDYD